MKNNKNQSSVICNGLRIPLDATEAGKLRKYRVKKKKK